MSKIFTFRSLILVLILITNFALADTYKKTNTWREQSWKENAKNLDEGRDAAAKFMNRKVAQVTAGDHYMAVHIGSFTSSEAYRWGVEDSWEDKADLNLGVTYRMGEWTNSMDLLIRAEFVAFEFDDKRPYKISIMPVIAFPDSRSQFPLYFGAGLGGGIFFKQASGESSLSLDYNLIAGARFFNVLDQIGIMIETGFKGHVHLLSDGQFNGIYVSSGLVFQF